VASTAGTALVAGGARAAIEALRGGMIAYCSVG